MIDGKNNAVDVSGMISDKNENKHSLQDLALLAAVVKCTDDAIITISLLDQSVTSWNLAAENMFGYTVDDALGQSVMFFIPENLFDKEWCIFEKLRDAAEFDHHFESQRKHQDGRLVDVSITASRINDECGRIIGISNIIRDITHQKQNESDLLSAYQCLQEQVATTKENIKKNSDQHALDKALNLIETSVLPFLEKLKAPAINEDQSNQLLKIIETNLQNLLLSNENNPNLIAAYQQLSPAENQVSSLIRQGLNSKDIALTLNISKETVNVHRKHIRKKLGLDNKATNLNSYLLSLRH